MLDETPLAPLGPAGLVFMASGQGSQKPGMGADLLDIPEVANVFACSAATVPGWCASRRTKN